MRKMKKLMSLLLTAIMIMSLGMTVFADENTVHTITITNESNNHVYEAYQVFVGKISEGKLVDIQWGSGVNGTTLFPELKKLDAYSACESPEDVAEVLAGFGDKSDKIKAFSEIVSNHLATVAGTSTESQSPYTISVQGDGYYFIKDKAQSLDSDNSNNDATEGRTYTEYILKVVSDVTVEAKDSTVSSEKKVKDTNDSTGETTGWQDSADYDIGDYIPFQLKATLPSNYKDYKKYSLTFHDDQAVGLSLVLDDDDHPFKVYVDGSEMDKSLYQVIVTSNADRRCSFEVKIADVKKTTAKNESVITVEFYSRLTGEGVVIGSAGNPNTMRVSYTNNPYDTQGGENGWTPDDTVIVFTYKTVVNKVDASGNPLSGAEFALKKFVESESGTETYNENKGNWVDVSVVKNTEGTTFTFSGLDDGEYKLVETTPPAGYNSIDDIYFTVTAGHDIESDSPALNSLSGDVVSGELTFTSDKFDGSLTTKVENRQGSILPSTGGIGTTIFYVLGTVLVLGAAIVLVTKKRMNVEE